MDIQHADGNIDEPTSSRPREPLRQFSERITRSEVHLSDEPFDSATDVVEVVKGVQRRSTRRRAGGHARLTGADVILMRASFVSTARARARAVARAPSSENRRPAWAPPSSARVVTVLHSWRTGHALGTRRAALHP